MRTLLYLLLIIAAFGKESNEIYLIVGLTAPQHYLRTLADEECGEHMVLEDEKCVCEEGYNRAWLF